MSDKSSILVTGGTGTLGRHVVRLLRESGHRARILTRHPHGHVDAVEGDLATGAGIARAVQGVDAIVHAASATSSPLNAGAVDVKGTRRLLEAAHSAGVKHVLLVSIVAVDKASSYPYYRAKLQAEAAVRGGGVGWSILRATQFHQFVDLMLGRFCAVPGVTLVPLAFQLQPVAVTEVARRVVGAVLGEPAGTLPDFGGPQTRDMRSLATAWLRARRSKRRLVNLPLPFRFAREMAAGALLCPEHRDGTVTFEEYLADNYPS